MKTPWVAFSTGAFLSVVLVEFGLGATVGTLIALYLALGYWVTKRFMEEERKAHAGSTSQPRYDATHTVAEDYAE